MKNAEIFGLLQALRGVSDLKGIKFAYAVLKNKNLLEQYAKKFSDSVGPSEEYNAFESERLKLVTEFSEKDEKGEPKLIEVEGRKEYDIKDQAGFDKKAEKLKKKYKKVLDERQEKLADFEKTLEAESGVKLHLISEEDIPQEITANQLELIQVMIKKDEK